MSAISDRKGLYRVGSVSMVSVGVLFMLSAVVHFSLLLGPPLSSEFFLRFVAVHSVLFEIVDVAFVLAGILLIPSMLTLYVALRDINRTRVNVAIGLASVAIFLFVVSSVIFYSLVNLSALYEGAGTEAQRAGYVATASLVIMFYNWVGILLAGSIFSGATIIICLVIRKSLLGKAPYYLGMIAGTAGVIGSIPLPGLPDLGLLSLVLFTFWFIAIAIRIKRLQ